MDRLEEKVDILFNKLDQILEILGAMPGGKDYEDAKNHFELNK